jgi:hypothetical protein
MFLLTGGMPKALDVGETPRRLDAPFGSMRAPTIRN